MNPPIVYEVTKPSAQRTSKMTATVQSISHPRCRHLHHIGGRRVAGGVPCMHPVRIGRTRLDGPVTEGRDMRSRTADLREPAGGTDTGSPARGGIGASGLGFGPC